MQKLIKFFKEVQAELIKVTWPTKSEIIGSTIVTVVVSVIMSIFVGIIDFALDKGIRAIF